LDRIKYPDYHVHKKEHEELVFKILEAVKEYEDGKKYVPNSFVHTLKDWICSHIAVYDQLYAAYVHEQKRKGLLTDEMLKLR
jgi:hemerythrin